MRVHHCCLRGITRTKEFKKKGFAQYAANVGTRCGHHEQAQAIGAVRNGAQWSRHVATLTRHLQETMRRLYDMSKLRFLLYPSGLTPEDSAQVRRDDAGIVWLGKE